MSDDHLDQTPLPRWEAIAELRRAGYTYAGIGEWFKLSGERVRQILAKHSPELLGIALARAREAKAPRRPPLVCPQCKTVFRKTPSEREGATRKFCSSLCQRRGHSAATKARFWREALKMRRAGATWEVIAEKMGYSSAASCYTSIMVRWQSEGCPPAGLPYRRQGAALFWKRGPFTKGCTR